MVSLRLNRKAVAVELKPAYFGVQVKNLREAETVRQTSLFAS